MSGAGWPENLVLALFAVAPLALGLALWAVHRRAAASRSPGAARLVVANLLLLGALLMGLALAGELYFRFVYDTTDAFAMTLTHQRWLERHYHTIPGGYRDRAPYALQRRPGVRRLTFLGDSFTAGHGVANIDDRFSNRIQASLPRWEVHTVARPGWNTPEQLRFVRQSGSAIDRVVLVYCPNDIVSFDPDARAVIDALYARSAPRHFLTRHSHLLNFLHYRWVAATLPELERFWDFAVTGFEGESWERQQATFRALHEAVEGAGGELWVVSFPFLHTLGPEDPFAPVQERLAAFWENEGVPHLDLRAAFAGLPPEALTVNRYDAHPNERAHALAAEAILEFLGFGPESKP